MFVGVELSFDFSLGWKSPENGSSRGIQSIRGVTKVFQSEVKNWRKKFHHHVQLINLLHDMVVTGFFLVMEMISVWQDIHDICPWVWECKPVLVDGSGISLARQSRYTSMSMGVQTGVGWWKWNLSAKTFNDMSMSMGLQTGVGWWKWNLKPQDIHDMSMSMGVEISVGWWKWNLSARHSWYVHEYWSANQSWSVMTKASKPSEVQAIYNLTHVVTTSSCGQKMQLGWRLLAGY